MTSNEAALHGGAGAAEQLRIHSSKSTVAKHSGEYSAGLASGSLDGRFHDDSVDNFNEQSPLLPNKGKGRSGAPQDGGAADGDGDDGAPAQSQEWPGLADFDHLPKYRRPSVRIAIAVYTVY